MDQMIVYRPSLGARHRARTQPKYELYRLRPVQARSRGVSPCATLLQQRDAANVGSIKYERNVIHRQHV